MLVKIIRYILLNKPWWKQKYFKLTDLYWLVYNITYYLPRGSKVEGFAATDVAIFSKLIIESVIKLYTVVTEKKKFKSINFKLR